ncbi:hypothetical protein AQUCO_00900416v1 [Aquilegia coerulea]|uniref:Uncharacterized protein n=1 Tax=Aquilegia coerulea TaxID=218851 RepID=A0A2G5EDM1_AQUCA|nr:hypothetical protein AQUCO_00900416v1 [Aquilegia coerulea]
MTYEGIHSHNVSCLLVIVKAINFSLLYSPLRRHPVTQQLDICCRQSVCGSFCIDAYADGGYGFRKPRIGG